jgi:hypothetical protein
VFLKRRNWHHWLVLEISTRPVICLLGRVKREENPVGEHPPSGTLREGVGFGRRPFAVC